MQLPSINWPPRPLTLATVSTKGGVGKTTITANLAALLADLGARVLLVNADPQPGLDAYFPLRQEAPHGLYHALVNGGVVAAQHLSEVDLPGLHPEGCVHLLRCDSPEASLQQWLYQTSYRETRIRQALASPDVQDYHFVLIDSQGAIGPLQDATVVAADLLLSPVRPDILSAREFVNRTAQMIERLVVAGGPFRVDIPPVRSLIYAYDERSVDARLVAEQIRQHLFQAAGRISLLAITVPDSVRYKDAATRRMPVHWYDQRRSGQRKPGAWVLHELVWELLPQLYGHFASNCEPRLQAEMVAWLETRAELPVETAAADLPQAAS